MNLIDFNYQFPDEADCKKNTYLMGKSNGVLFVLSLVPRRNIGARDISLKIAANLIGTSINNHRCWLLYKNN